MPVERALLAEDLAAVRTHHPLHPVDRPHVLGEVAHVLRLAHGTGHVARQPARDVASQTVDVEEGLVGEAGVALAALTDVGGGGQAGAQGRVGLGVVQAERLAAQFVDLSKEWERVKYFLIQKCSVLP